MAKLTAKRVRALMKPGPGKEYPDGEVPGLYCAIQPSGKGSWVLRYRFGGKTRKLSLGMFPEISVDMARAAALEARRTIETVKKAAKAPPKSDSIETAVAAFVEHIKPRNRSWPETQRILNVEVLPAWRGRRVGDIAKADVKSLLAGIMERRAPVMANRTLATIRRFFSWTVEEDLVEVSPCASIKAPSEETARERVLSDRELAQVLAAADACGYSAGPLIRLLALTGLRRGEIGNLKWSEVDFESATLTIPGSRTKTKSTYVVPLSNPAVAILAAIPRTGPMVFTRYASFPSSSFAAIKRNIDAALPEDFEPFVLHDLRRTAATGMARLGAPIHVVEKALHHTSGTFAGVPFAVDVEIGLRQSPAG